MPTPPTLESNSLTLKSELFQKIGRYPKDLEHLVVAWPGFVIKGSFKGSFLKLKAESRINFNLGNHLYLHIEIDGTKTIVALNQAAEVYVLGENLDPEGLHTFKITRQNEAFCGNILMSELITDGQFFEVPKKEFLVEAVGDSLLTGYGNEASQPHLPFNSKIQNFAKSMVALACESADVDLRVVAHAGKGVYSNYDGSTQSNLNDMYDELTPYAPSLYDHSDDQADIVILQGGTNDFSLSMPPQKKFVAAYVEWVEKVATRQPKAQFLALIGPMLNDEWPMSPITGQAIPSLTLYKTWLKEAIGLLKQKGILVETLELTPQDASRGFGSHWHPNLLQHQLNAVEIANWLKAKISGLKLLQS